MRRVNRCVSKRGASETMTRCSTVSSVPTLHALSTEGRAFTSPGTGDTGDHGGYHTGDMLNVGSNHHPSINFDQGAEPPLPFPFLQDAEGVGGEENDFVDFDDTDIDLFLMQARSVANFPPPSAAVGSAELLGGISSSGQLLANQLPTIDTAAPRINVPSQSTFDDGKGEALSTALRFILATPKTALLEKGESVGPLAAGNRVQNDFAETNDATAPHQQSPNPLCPHWVSSLRKITDNFPIDENALTANSNVLEEIERFEHALGTISAAAHDAPSRLFAEMQLSKCPCSLDELTSHLENLASDLLVKVTQNERVGSVLFASASGVDHDDAPSTHQPQEAQRLRRLCWKLVRTRDSLGVFNKQMGTKRDYAKEGGITDDVPLLEPQLSNLEIVTTKWVQSQTRRVELAVANLQVLSSITSSPCLRGSHGHNGNGSLGVFEEDGVASVAQVLESARNGPFAEASAAIMEGVDVVERYLTNHHRRSRDEAGVLVSWSSQDSIQLLVGGDRALLSSPAIGEAIRHAFTACEAGQIELVPNAQVSSNEATMGPLQEAVDGVAVLLRDQLIGRVLKRELATAVTALEQLAGAFIGLKALENNGSLVAFDPSRVHTLNRQRRERKQLLRAAEEALLECTQRVCKTAFVFAARAVRAAVTSNPLPSSSPPVVSSHTSSSKGEGGDVLEDHTAVPVARHLLLSPYVENHLLNSSSSTGANGTGGMPPLSLSDRQAVRAAALSMRVLLGRGAPAVTPTLPSNEEILQAFVEQHARVAGIITHHCSNKTCNVSSTLHSREMEARKAAWRDDFVSKHWNTAIGPAVCKGLLFPFGVSSLEAIEPTTTEALLGAVARAALGGDSCYGGNMLKVMRLKTTYSLTTSLNDEGQTSREKLSRDAGTKEPSGAAARTASAAPSGAGQALYLATQEQRKAAARGTTHIPVQQQHKPNVKSIPVIQQVTLMSWPQSSSEASVLSSSAARSILVLVENSLLLAAACRDLLPADGDGIVADGLVVAGDSIATRPRSVSTVFEIVLSSASTAMSTLLGGAGWRPCVLAAIAEFVECKGALGSDVNDWRSQLIVVLRLLIVAVIPLLIVPEQTENNNDGARELLVWKGDRTVDVSKVVRELVLDPLNRYEWLGNAPLPPTSSHQRGASEAALHSFQHYLRSGTALSTAMLASKDIQDGNIITRGIRAVGKLIPQQPNIDDDHASAARLAVCGLEVLSSPAAVLNFMATNKETNMTALLGMPVAFKRVVLAMHQRYMFVEARGRLFPSAASTGTTTPPVILSLIQSVAALDECGRGGSAIHPPRPTAPSTASSWMAALRLIEAAKLSIPYAVLPEGITLVNRSARSCVDKGDLMRPRGDDDNFKKEIAAHLPPNYLKEDDSEDAVILNSRDGLGGEMDDSGAAMEATLDDRSKQQRKEYQQSKNAQAERKTEAERKSRPYFVTDLERELLRRDIDNVLASTSRRFQANYARFEANDTETSTSTGHDSPPSYMKQMRSKLGPAALLATHQIDLKTSIKDLIDRYDGWGRFRSVEDFEAFAFILSIAGDEIGRPLLKSFKKNARPATSDSSAFHTSCPGSTPKSRVLALAMLSFVENVLVPRQQKIFSALAASSLNAIREQEAAKREVQRALQKRRRSVARVVEESVAAVDEALGTSESFTDTVADRAAPAADGKEKRENLSRKLSRLSREAAASGTGTSRQSERSRALLAAIQKEDKAAEDALTTFTANVIENVVGIIEEHYAARLELCDLALSVWPEDDAITASNQSTTFASDTAQRVLTLRYFTGRIRSLCSCTRTYFTPHAAIENHHAMSVFLTRLHAYRQSLDEDAALTAAGRPVRRLKVKLEKPLMVDVVREAGLYSARIVKANFDLYQYVHKIISSQYKKFVQQSKSTSTVTMRPDALTSRLSFLWCDPYTQAPLTNTTPSAIQQYLADLSARGQASAVNPNEGSSSSTMPFEVLSRRMTLPRDPIATGNACLRTSSILAVALFCKAPERAPTSVSTRGKIDLRTNIRKPEYEAAKRRRAYDETHDTSPAPSFSPAVPEHIVVYDNAVEAHVSLVANSAVTAAVGVVDAAAATEVQLASPRDMSHTHGSSAKWAVTRGLIAADLATADASATVLVSRWLSNESRRSGSAHEHANQVLLQRIELCEAAGDDWKSAAAYFLRHVGHEYRGCVVDRSLLLRVLALVQRNFSPDEEAAAAANQNLKASITGDGSLMLVDEQHQMGGTLSPFHNSVLAARTCNEILRLSDIYGYFADSEGDGLSSQTAASCSNHEYVAEMIRLLSIRRPVRPFFHLVLDHLPLGVLARHLGDILYGLQSLHRDLECHLFARENAAAFTPRYDSFPYERQAESSYPQQVHHRRSLLPSRLELLSHESPTAGTSSGDGTQYEVELIRQALGNLKSHTKSKEARLFLRLWAEIECRLAPLFPPNTALSSSRTDRWPCSPIAPSAPSLAPRASSSVTTIAEAFIWGSYFLRGERMTVLSILDCDGGFARQGLDSASGASTSLERFVPFEEVVCRYKQALRDARDAQGDLLQAFAQHEAQRGEASTANADAQDSPLIRSALTVMEDALSSLFDEFASLNTLSKTLAQMSTHTTTTLGAVTSASFERFTNVHGSDGIVDVQEVWMGVSQGGQAPHARGSRTHPLSRVLLLHGCSGSSHHVAASKSVLSPVERVWLLTVLSATRVWMLDGLQRIQRHWSSSQYERLQLPFSNQLRNLINACYVDVASTVQEASFAAGVLASSQVPPQQPPPDENFQRAVSAILEVLDAKATPSHQLFSLVHKDATSQMYSPRHATQEAIKAVLPRQSSTDTTPAGEGAARRRTIQLRLSTIGEVRERTLQTVESILSVLSTLVTEEKDLLVSRSALENTEDDKELEDSAVPVATGTSVDSVISTLLPEVVWLCTSTLLVSSSPATVKRVRLLCALAGELMPQSNSLVRVKLFEMSGRQTPPATAAGWNLMDDVSAPPDAESGCQGIVEPLRFLHSLLRLELNSTAAPTPQGIWECIGPLLHHGGSDTTASMRLLPSLAVRYAQCCGSNSLGSSIGDAPTLWTQPTVGDREFECTSSLLQWATSLGTGATSTDVPNPTATTPTSNFFGTLVAALVQASRGVGPSNDGGYKALATVLLDPPGFVSLLAHTPLPPISAASSAEATTNANPLVRQVEVLNALEQFSMSSSGVGRREYSDPATLLWKDAMMLVGQSNDAPSAPLDRVVHTSSTVTDNGGIVQSAWPTAALIGGVLLASRQLHRGEPGRTVLPPHTSPTSLSRLTSDAVRQTKSTANSSPNPIAVEFIQHQAGVHVQLLSRRLVPLRHLVEVVLPGLAGASFLQDGVIMRTSPKPEEVPATKQAPNHTLDAVSDEVGDASAQGTLFDKSDLLDMDEGVDAMLETGDEVAPEGMAALEDVQLEGRRLECSSSSTQLGSQNNSSHTPDNSHSNTEVKEDSTGNKRRPSTVVSKAKLMLLQGAIEASVRAMFTSSAPLRLSVGPTALFHILRHRSLDPPTSFGGELEVGNHRSKSSTGDDILPASEVEGRRHHRHQDLETFHDGTNEDARFDVQSYSSGRIQKRVVEFLYNALLPTVQKRFERTDTNHDDHLSNSLSLIDGPGSAPLATVARAAFIDTVRRQNRFLEAYQLLAKEWELPEPRQLRLLPTHSKVLYANSLNDPERILGAALLTSSTSAAHSRLLDPATGPFGLGAAATMLRDLARSNRTVAIAILGDQQQHQDLQLLIRGLDSSPEGEVVDLSDLGELLHGLDRHGDDRGEGGGRLQTLALAGKELLRRLHEWEDRMHPFPIIPVRGVTTGHLTQQHEPLKSWVPATTIADLFNRSNILGVHESLGLRHHVLCLPLSEKDYESLKIFDTSKGGGRGNATSAASPFANTMGTFLSPEDTEEMTAPSVGASSVPYRDPEDDPYLVGTPGVAPASRARGRSMRPYSLFKAITSPFALYPTNNYSAASSSDSAARRNWALEMYCRWRAQRHTGSGGQPQSGVASEEWLLSDNILLERASAAPAPQPTREAMIHKAPFFSLVGIQAATVLGGATATSRFASSVDVGSPFDVFVGLLRDALHRDGSPLLFAELFLSVCCKDPSYTSTQQPPATSPSSGTAPMTSPFGSYPSWSLSPSQRHELRPHNLDDIAVLVRLLRDEFTAEAVIDSAQQRHHHQLFYYNHHSEGCDAASAAPHHYLPPQGKNLPLLASFVLAPDVFSARNLSGGRHFIETYRVSALGFMWLALVRQASTLIASTHNEKKKNTNTSGDGGVNSAGVEAMEGMPLLIECINHFVFEEASYQSIDRQASSPTSPRSPFTREMHCTEQRDQVVIRLLHLSLHPSLREMTMTCVAKPTLRHHQANFAFSEDELRHIHEIPSGKKPLKCDLLASIALLQSAKVSVVPPPQALTRNAQRLDNEDSKSAAAAVSALVLPSDYAKYYQGKEFASSSSSAATRPSQSHVQLQTIDHRATHRIPATATLSYLSARIRNCLVQFSQAFEHALVAASSPNTLRDLETDVRAGGVRGPGKSLLGWVEPLKQVFNVVREAAHHELKNGVANNLYLEATNERSTLQQQRRQTHSTVYAAWLLRTFITETGPGSPEKLPSGLPASVTGDITTHLRTGFTTSVVGYLQRKCDDFYSQQHSTIDNRNVVLVNACRRLLEELGALCDDVYGAGSPATGEQQTSSVPSVHLLLDVLGSLRAYAGGDGNDAGDSDRDGGLLGKLIDSAHNMYVPLYYQRLSLERSPSSATKPTAVGSSPNYNTFSASQLAAASSKEDDSSILFVSIFAANVLIPRILGIVDRLVFAADQAPSAPTAPAPLLLFGRHPTATRGYVEAVLRVASGESQLVTQVPIRFWSGAASHVLRAHTHALRPASTTSTHNIATIHQDVPAGPLHKHANNAAAVLRLWLVVYQKSLEQRSVSAGGTDAFRGAVTTAAYAFTTVMGLLTKELSKSRPTDTLVSLEIKQGLTTRRWEPHHRSPVEKQRLVAQLNLLFGWDRLWGDFAAATASNSARHSMHLTASDLANILGGIYSQPEYPYVPLASTATNALPLHHRHLQLTDMVQEFNGTATTRSDNDPPTSSLGPSSVEGDLLTMENLPDLLESGDDVASSSSTRRHQSGLLRFERTLRLLEDAASGNRMGLTIPSSAVASTLSWLVCRRSSDLDDCHSVVNIFVHVASSHGALTLSPESLFAATAASTRILTCFASRIGSIGQNTGQHQDFLASAACATLVDSVATVVNACLPKCYLFQQLSVFDAIPRTNVQGRVDSVATTMGLLRALESAVGALQLMSSESVQSGRTTHAAHTNPNEQLSRRTQQQQSHQSLADPSSHVDRQTLAKLRLRLQRLIHAANVLLVHITAILINELDNGFNPLAYSLLRGRLSEEVVGNVVTSSSIPRSLRSFLDTSVPRLVRSRFVTPPPYVLQTGSFSELLHPTAAGHLSTVAEVGNPNARSDDKAVETFSNVCRVIEQLLRGTTPDEASAVVHTVAMLPFDMYLARYHSKVYEDHLALTSTLVSHQDDGAAPASLHDSEVGDGPNRHSTKNHRRGNNNKGANEGSNNRAAAPPPKQNAALSPLVLQRVMHLQRLCAVQHVLVSTGVGGTLIASKVIETVLRETSLFLKRYTKHFTPEKPASATLKVVGAAKRGDEAQPISTALVVSVRSSNSTLVVNGKPPTTPTDRRGSIDDDVIDITAAVEAQQQAYLQHLNGKRPSVTSLASTAAKQSVIGRAVSQSALGIAAWCLRALVTSVPVTPLLTPQTTSNAIRLLRTVRYCGVPLATSLVSWSTALTWLQLSTRTNFPVPTKHSDNAALFRQGQHNAFPVLSWKYIVYGRGLQTRDTAAVFTNTLQFLFHDYIIPLSRVHGDGNTPGVARSTHYAFNDALRGMYAPVRDLLLTSSGAVASLADNTSFHQLLLWYFTTAPLTGNSNVTSASASLEEGSVLVKGAVSILLDTVLATALSHQRHEAARQQQQSQPHIKQGFGRPNNSFVGAPPLTEDRARSLLTTLLITPLTGLLNRLYHAEQDHDAILHIIDQLPPTYSIPLSNGATLAVSLRSDFFGDLAMRSAKKIFPFPAALKDVTNFIRGHPHLPHQHTEQKGVAWLRERQADDEELGLKAVRAISADMAAAGATASGLVDTIALRRVRVFTKKVELYRDPRFPTSQSSSPPQAPSSAAVVDATKRAFRGRLVILDNPVLRSAAFVAFIEQLWAQAVPRGEADVAAVARMSQELLQSSNHFGDINTVAPLSTTSVVDHHHQHFGNIGVSVQQALLQASLITLNRTMADNSVSSGKQQQLPIFSEELRRQVASVIRASLVQLLCVAALGYDPRLPEALTWVDSAATIDEDGAGFVTKQPVANVGYFAVHFATEGDGNAFLQPPTWYGVGNSVSTTAALQLLLADWDHTKAIVGALWQLFDKEESRELLLAPGGRRNNLLASNLVSAVPDVAKLLLVSSLRPVVTGHTPSSASSPQTIPFISSRLALTADTALLASLISGNGTPTHATTFAALLSHQLSSAVTWLQSQEPTTDAESAVASLRSKIISDLSNNKSEADLVEHALASLCVTSIVLGSSAVSAWVEAPTTLAPLTTRLLRGFDDKPVTDVCRWLIGLVSSTCDVGRMVVDLSGSDAEEEIVNGKQQQPHPHSHPSMAPPSTLHSILAGILIPASEHIATTLSVPSRERKMFGNMCSEYLSAKTPSGSDSHVIAALQAELASNLVRPMRKWAEKEVAQQPSAAVPSKCKSFGGELLEEGQRYVSLAFEGFRCGCLSRAGHRSGGGNTAMTTSWPVAFVCSLNELALLEEALRRFAFDETNKAVALELYTMCTTSTTIALGVAVGSEEPLQTSYLPRRRLDTARLLTTLVQQAALLKSEGDGGASTLEALKKAAHTAKVPLFISPSSSSSNVASTLAGKLSLSTTNTATTTERPSPSTTTTARSGSCLLDGQLSALQQSAHPIIGILALPPTTLQAKLAVDFNQVHKIKYLWEEGVLRCTDAIKSGAIPFLQPHHYSAVLRLSSLSSLLALAEGGVSAGSGNDVSPITSTLLQGLVSPIVDIPPRLTSGGSSRNHHDLHEALAASRTLLSFLEEMDLDLVADEITSEEASSGRVGNSVVETHSSLIAVAMAARAIALLVSRLRQANDVAGTALHRIDVDDVINRLVGVFVTLAREGLFGRLQDVVAATKTEECHLLPAVCSFHVQTLTLLLEAGSPTSRGVGNVIAESLPLLAGWMDRRLSDDVPFNALSAMLGARMQHILTQEKRATSSPAIAVAASTINFNDPLPNLFEIVAFHIVHDEHKIKSLLALCPGQPNEGGSKLSLLLVCQAVARCTHSFGQSRGPESVTRSLISLVEQHQDNTTAGMESSSERLAFLRYLSECVVQVVSISPLASNDCLHRCSTSSLSTFFSSEHFQHSGFIASRILDSLDNDGSFNDIISYVQHLVDYEGHLFCYPSKSGAIIDVSEPRITLLWNGSIALEATASDLFRELVTEVCASAAVVPPPSSATGSVGVGMPPPDEDAILHLLRTST